MPFVPPNTGNGDVVGPGSATDGNVAVFSGTTGKIIADGGPLPTGNVTKVGTPVDNQVGVWTGDGTIEGDAALTFDTTTNTLTTDTFAGNLTGNAATVTGVDVNAGTFELIGDDATILRTSAATDVTLPTTGTLATLAGTEELDNKTLDSSVGKGTWTASGTWTIPAVTAGGTVTLAENSSIALDPAGSADGKFTGITITGTAGATLAFGDLIYLDPTDSRWELTDANAASGADGDARGIIGMCVLAAAADGDPTTILLNGVIRADAAFPAMTINAPFYVSETAGDITSTAPTTTDAVVRTCGYAITADELYFNPASYFQTAV